MTLFRAPLPETLPIGICPVTSLAFVRIPLTLSFGRWPQWCGACRAGGGGSWHYKYFCVFLFPQPYNKLNWDLSYRVTYTNTVSFSFRVDLSSKRLLIIAQPMCTSCCSDIKVKLPTRVCVWFSSRDTLLLLIRHDGRDSPSLYTMLYGNTAPRHSTCLCLLDANARLRLYMFIDFHHNCECIVCVSDDHELKLLNSDHTTIILQRAKNKK